MEPIVKLSQIDIILFHPAEPISTTFQNGFSGWEIDMRTQGERGRRTCAFAPWILLFFRTLKDKAVKSIA